MRTRRVLWAVGLCLAGVAGVSGYAAAYFANGTGAFATEVAQQTTTPPSIIQHKRSTAQPASRNIAAEMRGVVKDCERSERYAAYHDCTCVGKAYVRARSGNGRALSASAAREKTQDSCIDVARATRYEYGLCTDNHKYDHGNYQPFCKCFADARVRAFARSPGGPVEDRATAHEASQKCVSLWPSRDNHAAANSARANSGKSAGLAHGAPADLAHVPTSVLNERQLLLADCHNGGPNASLLHDCNCIADRFVKARLGGDTAVLSDIYPRLSKGACPNIPGTTKYVYESCAGYYKNQRADYVAFCTCVGKETAQNFARSPYYGKLAYMRSQAMQKCGMVTHGRPFASATPMAKFPLTWKPASGPSKRPTMAAG